MSDRSDDAPSGGDRGPTGEVAGPETLVLDRLRDAEPGGIDPVRYAILGAGTFAALAGAWLVANLVQLQFTDPVVLGTGGPGPVGMRMQQPSDLFLATSSSYGILLQLGPILGVLLGFVVGRSVEERAPGGLLAAASITVGATVTTFLLALLYLLTHEDSGSVDVVGLLEPAVYSMIAVALACAGTIAALHTFESFDDAAP